MPEEQQQAEEVSIDTLDPKSFNEAREKGLTAVPKAPVEEPHEGDEPKPDDKPKVKGGFQKRIDRLVKHSAELETAKEAADRRIAELEAKIGKTEGKQTPKADDEPKEEDFTGDVKAFFKAQARWEARQEIRAQEEAREQAAQEAETKGIFAAHEQTMSAARARYEDYDEVVKATDTPWQSDSKADVAASQAFTVALIESGNGGEILYYLSTHPEEMEKFGGKSPAQVTMLMGSLMDKLEITDETDDETEIETEPDKEVPKPKIVSKAPAPIKPVGGSSTKSTVPLDKLDPIAFNKAREQGRIR